MITPLFYRNVPFKKLDEAKTFLSDFDRTKPEDFGVTYAFDDFFEKVFFSYNNCTVSLYYRKTVDRIFVYKVEEKSTKQDFYIKCSTSFFSPLHSFCVTENDSVIRANSRSSSTRKNKLIETVKTKDKSRAIDIAMYILY